MFYQMFNYLLVSGSSTMSDTNTETRIADALERIADSLETIAKRPGFLKTVESRIEKAIDVNNSVVEEVVEKVVAEEPVFKEDIEKSSVPVKESKKNDGLEPGLRVKIESDTVNNGCIGSIVELKGPRWVIVSVEKGNDVKNKGETLSVSRGECVVLKGEGNAETATEVIEEPELAPETPELIVDEDDADHPGNYRIDTGTYAGRTVHDVYSVEGGGQKVIHFMAFKGSSKYAERAKILQAYLALYGIKEYPEA